MQPKPPVDVVPLFPPERRALLDHLATLAPAQWEAATVCPGWTLKDIVAHLLGDDLGTLAGGRDGYRGGWLGGTPDWDTLLRFINIRNEEWVQAHRRLSPRVLMELLEFTGSHTATHFAARDPLVPGPNVAWAGPGTHPMWLHIAREYTERWAHQAQIRDATGASSLRERRRFFPVLDTFVHALPFTYRDVTAAPGTHVQIQITGPAGGSWSLVYPDPATGWGLYIDVATPPAATVTLDEDTAWRLFTKGITPAVAAQTATLVGDAALGQVALTAVAIIA